MQTLTKCMHSVCQVYAIDANAYQVYPFFHRKKGKKLNFNVSSSKEKAGFSHSNDAKIVSGNSFFPFNTNKKTAKM